MPFAILVLLGLGLQAGQNPSPMVEHTRRHHRLMQARPDLTDPLLRVTNYSHDAWGRLTAIDYPAGGSADVTLGYDAEGRLTSSVDGTGSRTFTYDSWGRKVAQTDPRGNTSATYDGAGRILTQTDVSARQIVYDYDLAGRLSLVGDGAGNATYEYTVNGEVSIEHYPNGTQVEYFYDNARRVSSITHRKVSDWSATRNPGQTSGTCRLQRMESFSLIHAQSLRFVADTSYRTAPNWYVRGQRLEVYSARPALLAVKDITPNEHFTPGSFFIGNPFDYFVSEGTHQYELARASNIYIRGRAARALHRYKSRMGFLDPLCIDMIFDPRIARRRWSASSDEVSNAQPLLETRDLKYRDRLRILVVNEESGLPFAVRIHSWNGTKWQETETTKFLEWEFNPRIPPQTFTWDPPPGSSLAKFF